MKPRLKDKRTYKLMVIVANIVVVTAILIILLTYVQSESNRRKITNQEQFEAVTNSMAQTIVGRLEAHQELVDSAAHYINSRSFTIEEATEYLKQINLDDDHMFHVVWIDDSTGLSTRASKLDASDYTVDYTGISSARIASEKFIKAMSILFDESPDKSIHASRAFNNPIDAESSVAFYNKVTLNRDGVQTEAMVLLLTGVNDLRNDYNFPEGIFEGTGTAIIDTYSGNYVLPHAELKNTSFFEYLIQYNDINYQDLETLKNEISQGNTVSETYLDYKGQEVRYIISEVEGSDGWTLVSFLPVSDLDALTDDNIWPVCLSLIALILMMLVFDLIYFVLLNRHLEKANNSKTEFLSTMSHDIRTPLNAIIGLTTLTKNKTGDEELVKRNLLKIEQSGQHLLTLINDILDISKIESGKINFNNAPFNPGDAKEYLDNLCRPSAEDKGLHLSIDTELLSDYCVMGDRLRFYQVLINILTNAIKYTNNGGYVMARLTETKKSDGEVSLQYVVRDSGIGMSPEFMEHMYESFSRAKDGRIDKVQGTGLGLAICKRIVDAMGGTIDCESRVNEGTTFTVTFNLPLVKEEKTADNNNNNNNNNVPSAGPMHVLVAEDNDLNWEIIEEMLDIKDIKSDRAENGKEAVYILDERAEEYDLVLMDIQMPVMNGLEAARCIRSSEKEYMKNIPIIALTADAFAENIEECLNCGINSHVAKPINIDILMNEIDKVMRKEGK